MKKTNKSKGCEFESEIIKSINSGALAWQKGDGQTKDYCIEIKYTEKKGFKITTDILEKLWNDAFDANKLPKLIIGIQNDNITWKLSCYIKKEVK